MRSRHILATYRLRKDEYASFLFAPRSFACSPLLKDSTHRFTPLRHRASPLSTTAPSARHDVPVAHGTQPWEYVDHAYSLYPHGDGHFTASESSSRTACLIAGDDWVEFTVGRNTKGSVRTPVAFVASAGTNTPVRKKRETIRFLKMLFYPKEHFPVSNPAAQVLYDNFAAAL
ncbi:hypothetical protein C0992_005848 [Termitomyces sp. T32_za158]|nr:hypothetical protein C0992_005848 [Termitomyces sp. T32_za158]